MRFGLGGGGSGSTGSPHARPLLARRRARSRCCSGAAAGPLNPCVIQESGRTRTFLLLEWSNRAGDRRPLTDRQRVAGRGQDEDTFCLFVCV